MTIFALERILVCVQKGHQIGCKPTVLAYVAFLCLLAGVAFMFIGIALQRLR